MMAEYTIIGSYPRYAITRNGAFMDSFLCNTLEQANELIKDLEDNGYVLNNPRDLKLIEEQDNGS